MTTESVWQARLAGFVDELASHDGLLSPEWEAAFRRVPRHAFVPRIIGCSPANEDGLKEGFVLDADHDADEWLRLVYSNRVLMVVLKEEPERFSSSSRPSVMTRFLRLLDVQNGNTVLEIGTGTGYNAALLCERVGSDHVTTIDVDAELVDAARAALAACGYTPTVAFADGFYGCQSRAPYDRIIATCAVARIPPAWRDQLGPDGLLVAPLHNNLLVGLRRQPDGSLVGRCDLWGADFMELRSPEAPSPDERPANATEPRSTRTIARPPSWYLSMYLRFFAGLLTPGLRFSGSDGDVDWALTTVDGSWGRVEGEAGEYRVTQVGEQRPWELYEAAARQWDGLGRPRWDRYGLTVRPDGGQFIWLDSPDSEHRWEL